MKKKAIILIVVVVLVLVTSIFYSTQNQESDIEYAINTALHIQYGWKNIDNLKEVCTEEFIENADLDELYLGRKIYSIDKDYMNNIQKISENELVIYVNVYSPDITIHKFTLIEKEDGEYLISKIEHDI